MFNTETGGKQCDICHQKQKIKRSQKSHCRAPNINGDLCSTYSLKGKHRCRHHQYMEDYTDEMLKTTVQCSSCRNMYWEGEERCPPCYLKNKDSCS